MYPLPMCSCTAVVAGTPTVATGTSIAPETPLEAGRAPQKRDKAPPSGQGAAGRAVRSLSHRVPAASLGPWQRGGTSGSAVTLSGRPGVWLCHHCSHPTSLPGAPSAAPVGSLLGTPSARGKPRDLNMGTDKPRSRSISLAFPPAGAGVQRTPDQVASACRGSAAQPLGARHPP